MPNWIDTLDARARGVIPGFHSVNATTEEIDAAEAAAIADSIETGDDQPHAAANPNLLPADEGETATDTKRAPAKKRR